MKPIDILILLLIVAIVGAAIAYIVRAKKKGARCIGCPAGECCQAKNAGHDDPARAEEGCCSCRCNE